MAINSDMPEQAKMHTVKLKKYDDFYHEMKIFHVGQATGFLKGIIHQMGFVKPTKNVVNRVARGLYFRQCEVSF